MDATNVTADAFSHVSSSERVNSERIFTSEKIDKSDKLVNAINNLTIKKSGYELDKATVIDTQGDPTSDPDTVTHTSNDPDTVTNTSNIILDQNLLSCRTIRKLSILPPLTNPTIRLTPQTLLMSAVKEIFADATSGNAWNVKTLRRFIMTGVDRSIPIYTLIGSRMSKYSTPTSSDSTRTRGTGIRIPIETTPPLSGLNMNLEIDDIRQSTTQYLRNSNKLDTSID